MSDETTDSKSQRSLEDLPEVDGDDVRDDENASADEAAGDAEAAADEPADDAEAAAGEGGEPADEAADEPADDAEAAADDAEAAADEASAAHHQPRPSSKALQAELNKERSRNIFIRVLRSTVFSLVVVAAVAVIVATLVLPILQISGTSMTDTLQDQDIVVTMRTSDCKTGDIVAFYYNNKILVKRVIANSGQWVDIDADGNVYVDNVKLDEPYVKDRALGDCNIKLPYQVPEGRTFVMGDHRSVSVDSRSTTVGCVSDEQLVGKLLLRAWPVSRFGPVS